MVSVVIPHHNRSALLRETLASLEAQTDPDWEAIVVDHDSAEEERKAADAACRESERVRFLHRENGPLGPSPSRNLGLEAARGSYVIFLDSDDLLAPWCLERRVKEITSDSALGFVVFDALLFEREPDDGTNSWNRLDGEDDLLRFLRSDAPWCVSGPIWRVEVIRKLGGFHDEVFYGDDAELHTRALLQKICYRKAPPSIPPDHYIRRSPEIARATQGTNAVVEASRITRLVETSRLLEAHHAEDRLRDCWSGQYFREAEYLLFRSKAPRAEIAKVLHAWKRFEDPGPFVRSVAHTYLTIAIIAKDRCYLVLRLARRLAQLFLPSPCFS